MIVHDQEKQAVDLLKINTEYLVDAAILLKQIQASAQSIDQVYIISTPAGEVHIPHKETYMVAGSFWLDIRTLNRYLRLNARFNQAQYALVVQPPWNKGKSSTPAAKLKIDVYPNQFSVNQFRLKLETQSAPNQSSQQSAELITRGSAFGGSWRVDLNQDRNQDWKPSDYYWLKRNDNTQLLVGTQTLAPSTLIPAVDMTGAHYFYSNKKIKDDAYNDISQSGFYQRRGDAVQSFSGQGERGSLVQLHIEGRLVREDYVDLNGQFELGRVQLPSSLYNQVELIFIDPASGTVIEERNLSRSNVDRLIEAGQLITGIAAGKSGNALDSDDTEHGYVAMTTVKYGLSDRTTIEAAIVDQNHDNSMASIGLTQAIGAHLVVAGHHAENDKSTTSQLDLDSSGENWRFSGQINRTKPVELDSKAQTHSRVFYSYLVNEKLSLMAEGRGYSDKDRKSYLLPSIYFKPTKFTSVNIRPTSDAEYKTDFRYEPQAGKRLRLSHVDQDYSARIDWPIGETQSAYYTYRNSLDEGNNEWNNESAVGMYWRPERLQPYGFLRAQISDNERSGIKYYLEARSKIYPGIYLDLNLTETTEGPEAGTTIFSRLTFDYAYAGKGFVASNSSSSHNINGSIIGRLAIPQSECDIDEVSVLVDRIPFKAPVSNCKFQVNKLKPGVYKVSLDTDGLPIEYVPENQSYNVQIGPSAVSNVTFSVHKEYGVAGQVTDSKGIAAFSKIDLYDDSNTLLGQHQADQFGYYRIDQLRPGKYVIKAENAIETLSIEIVNDFLFDQNIQLENKF